MVDETILQSDIVAKFILPFALIFFIVFAILEKTKIFGEDKKQLNAFIAGVIGIIFVSAVFPKVIVGNLILFLTVALVVVFVGILLWGFVSGDELTTDFMEHKGVKWTAGVVILIAVVIGLLWAADIEVGVLDFLFAQTWSKTFWTNAAFIGVIAGVLWWAVASGGGGGGDKKDKK